MMVWDEAVVARLAELYSRGLSYKKIAETLGVSRSAISGKINRQVRLGDKRFEFRVKRELAADKPAVKKPKPTRVVKAGLYGFRVKTPSVSDEPLPQLEVVLQHTKSLMDLNPFECRYPYGDSMYSFCARPTKIGSSYCEHHNVMCWVKPVRR
jgi:hypothetical protein